jgi:hypothetical protein
MYLLKIGTREHGLKQNKIHWCTYVKSNNNEINHQIELKVNHEMSEPPASIHKRLVLLLRYKPMTSSY